MNTYLYFRDDNRALVILSKYPKFFTDAKFICSKVGKLNVKHFNRLRQFRLSDGTYMMSEDLLMILARSFNQEFEDLWNIVYDNGFRNHKEDLDEFNFV